MDEKRDRPWAVPVMRECAEVASDKAEGWAKLASLMKVPGRDR